MLVNIWQDMSQQCAHVVRSILACVKNSVVSRTRAVIVPGYSTLVSLHLECCAQLWAPHKNIDVQECIQSW